MKKILGLVFAICLVFAGLSIVYSVNSFVYAENINPTEIFSGDTEIYITDKDDIYSYSMKAYSPEDSGELMVYCDDDPYQEMTSFGKYEQVFRTNYKGEDVYITRIIHYGEVALTSSSVATVSYGVEFKFPLKFNEFNVEDFDIKYTVQADLTEHTYNYSQGIVATDKFIAGVTFHIELKYQKNTKIVYYFDYVVGNVVDDIKPTLTLNGNKELSMFVGQPYDEAGYTVSDNKTLASAIKVSINYYSLINGNFAKVDKLYNNKEGKCKIEYIAEDESGLMTKDERIITFVYDDITSVNIVEGRLLSKYSQGQKITLYLNFGCEYTANPDVYVIWYVNDEEVKRTYGDSMSIKFDEEGTYKITAKLLGNDDISTQEIEIEIYKKSPYETVFLVGGIVVGAITLFGFIAFLANKYRKRNFY